MNNYDVSFEKKEQGLSRLSVRLDFHSGHDLRVRESTLTRGSALDVDSS